MKTFIIQLEQHDDIISARDRMGWAKSGRLLLVWPKRGRLLNRRLDLVLLQRYSTSLGAPLALVTHDPEVLFHAPRLGIPAYKTLHQAQNLHWRVPKRFRDLQTENSLLMDRTSKSTKSFELISGRENQSTRHTTDKTKHSAISRIFFFTLGVLALLSIAATLLPSAQVTLVPQIQSQETTIEVRASSGIKTVNISGLVPAHQKIIIVEGRESLPVSGAILLPDRPAMGHVTFTNLTDQLVIVPEGTVVRTQGRAFAANPSTENSSTEDKSLRFTVTQVGEIPAGSGNTVSMPVRCISPGSSGNLPAQSLVAIEGLLGTQLSVTNPEPTRGGTERRELAPTQADRRKLADKLQSSLERTALLEIQETLSPGDILIPSSLTLLNTLEETYQPSELQPADRLSLNQRIEFQASFVSTEDLHTLAEAVLDANVPKGFSPILSTLEIENLGRPVIGQDTIAQWKLHVKRQIQAQFPKTEAIRLALGMKPDHAAMRLESFLLLREPPRISLFPAWWPRLPFIPFRISIIVL